jgi:integrase
MNIEINGVPRDPKPFKWTMRKLTDAIVTGLPVTGKDYVVFDAREAGFGIRVTPAGTKLWVAKASHAGRKTRVTVGTFPDVNTAEARALARAAVSDIRAGRNPTAERRARAAAVQSGGMTVASLADKWMADHVRPKLKPRTVADYERMLAKHILPAVGHILVSALGRDDVIKMHVGMGRTPRSANYTLLTLGGIMAFACDNKLRPPLDNPCRRIKLFKEGRHERFLSETEIGSAAEAIAKAEKAGAIGVHAAAGLRLALFTGARSGEITAAKWSQVDWDRRFIRLPDSKTGDPRTIHLSDAALEVLRGIPRREPYVIAGTRPGEPYKNLTRAWIIARAKAGLNDVRLHDLRHSYASLAAGRGVPLAMIGKLLGHKTPATTQRYAHLARDAVAAVNDELGDAMLAAIDRKAPENAKVIKMRRGRK